MSETLLIIAKWVAFAWSTFKDWLKFNIRDELYYKWYKNERFYFKEYTKHLTIYKNGHGIIINSFLIRVLNDEQFNEFKRTIDISDDSKKEACFKPLKTMCGIDKFNRFDKLGFWYECETRSTSHCLITEVEEVEQNDKLLTVSFKIDKRTLKSAKKKLFRLSYALSIPGLFPIENGVMDIENKPDNYDKFNSSLTVKHRIEKLTYIISFEKGIEIDNSSIQFYNIHKKNDSSGENINKTFLKYKFKNNFFYDKYILDINKPKYQNTIAIDWNVKI